MSHPRVLLVDDDKLVTVSLGRLLEQRCDVRVLEVLGPIQALDYLNAAPNAFELIVADYSLPGIDGTHLLAICMERWPNMRRVIYTGRKDWSEPFADAILIKGDPPGDIVKRLCDLAHTPRRQDHAK